MSQLVLRFSNAAKWAGTAYKNKVWRAGHFWFFRAGRLGGVIYKPEGVKTPPSLRARKNQERTMDRLYFISKMPKNVNKFNLKFLTVRILELYSACYGGCPLLDTSNIRIAYHGRHVLELLSVSAFIVPTENNAFFEG